jgi:hypothetical protein
MARSLPADLAFLLSVSEGLTRARVELEQTKVANRAR